MIMVKVSDNGVPQLSTTNNFPVTVYAANTSPVFSPIPESTVHVDSLLTFKISATDTDSPPQVLTYVLGPGAPDGASISPDGNFLWTPNAGQASTTNTLFVVATDSGVPALSATNSFLVTVLVTSPAPVLQSSTVVLSGYTDVTGAVVDIDRKTITTAAPAEPRFYRLMSNVALRITSVTIYGGNLIFSYQ